jgi:hypothetical protein
MPCILGTIRVLPVFFSLRTSWAEWPRKMPMIGRGMGAVDVTIGSGNIDMASGEFFNAPSVASSLFYFPKL